MESKSQQYKNIWIAGIDDKRFDITVDDGRFASIKEAIYGYSSSAQSSIYYMQDSNLQQNNTQENLWICPGIIDLHTHLAWTDFDSSDQMKRDPQEVEELQAKAFEATLRAGVTTVRDAGGLLPEKARYIARHYGHALKVEACGGMLGGEDSKGLAYLEKRVEEVKETKANWLKIFATGGLGAHSDKVLEPLLTKEEFLGIVHSAHKKNIKVMVHTWGGATIDWAVEAGVDSVEHGVYLTEKQAEGLAKAGIPYIPTTAIYRIAAEKDGVLNLNQELRDRAGRAACAHPKAIKNAKNAGVKIGFGTDFATQALHGNNLEEIYTLMDCGLTRKEAWQAATEIAADILGAGDRLGRIKEGFLADVVIFSSDPFKSEKIPQVFKIS